MRYLFGIYKELIKCGLQRNSDKIVLYRSIYGISSELDITRIYMNMVKLSLFNIMDFVFHELIQLSRVINIVRRKGMVIRGSTDEKEQLC